MPEDKLRHNWDDVEDLESIIDARSESTSHFAHDQDSADTDLEIPEDIDVDDALTFPHPKHKPDPNRDIDLMDTPHKGQIDIEWTESQQDMLPSDYESDYDDALTTELADEDSVAEDQIGLIDHVEPEEFSEEPEMTTPLPKSFRPDELGPG